LHRLQVLHDLRGAAGVQTVTVLDWPKLSQHLRPTPRQSRLYCLADASAVAARLGLDAAAGPYYKMLGWPGSNPLVGSDLDNDPHVRFARVLANSEAGTAPTDTAAALFAQALTGDAAIRCEAARFLIERGDLRAKFTAIQWTQILARASGEVDDTDYKIVLAELCAEQRLAGLLDALAVSLGPVADPEYARAVGRIGRALHGEAVTSMLEQRLQRAAQPQDRAALLLAIGASNTASALATLLRMDSKDAAVEAALREHSSPRAKEAVARRR
jgi:hypothetical protein